MASRGRTAAAPKARRLKPEVREQQILAEAIRYFSAHGRAASTVELARRLGVTQPLLFRYFPTKDALIQRIYDEIETQIFNPEWVEWIEDPSRALGDRLVAFYRDYVHRVMTEDRFRLFLHEGLSSERAHADRYYGLLQRTVLAALVRALRREFGSVPEGGRDRAGQHDPATDREMEVVLTLHGMIHHLAIRRWVYGPALTDGINDLVALKVSLFLNGAPAVLRTATQET